jgi:TPP-dependent pyruvate/acetoin dehydrogenase alpha subunit
MTTVDPHPKPLERTKDFGWTDEAMCALSDSEAILVFRQTCFNRYFEFECAQAANAKRIKAPIYLSVGQEHIPATLALVFPGIKIFAQHRGHSYFLSFGGNPQQLADELLHRETGCARGMGGSPSIHSPEIGMFGHSGHMGDQVPIAVGYALASRCPSLTVVGDASAEEDYVLGAMGYAATKGVPLLLVCEDNDLSILTKTETRRNWNLADVAKSFGIEAVDISDDPWLIAFHARRAHDSLPFLMNIRTCRQLWHAGTGCDGEPEWNRFEIFKAQLAARGLADDVATIEEQAKRKAASFWI